MKKSMRCVLIASLISISAPVQAADPPPAVQKIFDKIINAIKANDRDAFVADGTDAVKENTTKELMENLSKQLGSRLKKGYQATYLCQLKQAEHEVYLWKTTYKDEGDDVVIRISMKDGKVAGFFLQ